MNKELQKVTKEWMKLERKTLEQRKEADRYYDENLMDLIMEDYITRNKKWIRDEADYLIVSVGTSYEPIVLNISLLAPKKIMFLYTEKSEATLDKSVSYCGLKPSVYEKRLINEIDPTDIYQKIKEVYLEWGSPKNVHIDFTGGTKAMSAAAALAGAMIDAEMIYVASDDYLVDFRKPNPGSENLTYIDNPLSVFGDIEIGKAFDLYAQQDFAGASERLGVLKESMPDPVLRQELCFDHLISKVYEAWDALDFSRAAENMEELIFQLKRDGRRYKTHPLNRNSDILMEQASCLKSLGRIPALVEEKAQTEILQNTDIIIPLMLTMHMNAKTRESQQKYDMATLLTYRLLEMIEQRRLSKYNLFVSDMKYEEIHLNKQRNAEILGMDGKGRMDWLRSEVYSIRQELFKGHVSEYLPNPVSLLDGFIILAALSDPIFKQDRHDRIAVLKQMRSKVYLRNNSIFAHGLGPVPKEDYEKFRDFVGRIFERFCQIEQIDLEKKGNIYRWIPLSDEED
ncbi:MAG: TIGR02710 family CRISPR-associated protein [Lachnospiraceae bacterium]|nr:TIGR02710 family CRISPR-associated protein [Lachnospiraceae bacterium]